MNPRKKLFSVCVLAASAAIWTACGETPQADDAITEAEAKTTEIDQNDLEKAKRVKHVFRAVPSPMEMASMLKKTGATYNTDFLNDVKNVNTYNTSRSQALNLGIYGAGLSYASVFNQNQESIIYLSCAKKLADNLGVSKAFDDETIERMEANVDNRDSLLNIVSETYYMLDAYLKENGRENISAMVITGGWIEGLHISTSVAVSSDEPSEELLRRIADQKISLANLIELIEDYNSGERLGEVLTDLNTLKGVFDKAVIVEKGASQTATDGDGVAVIGGTVESSFSQDGLAEIHSAVEKIRARYIS
jgi:hypothetical protein